MNDEIKYFDVEDKSIRELNDSLSCYSESSSLEFNPLSKIFISATTAFTISSSSLNATIKKKNQVSDKISFKICQSENVSEYYFDSEFLEDDTTSIYIETLQDVDFLRSNIITKILSFKSLINNWDGFGAIPLEIKAAANSIELIRFFDKKTLNMLKECLPNPHGTLSFLFSNLSGEKVELEIGNNEFSYYVDYNNIDTLYFDSLNFYSQKDIKKLIEFINSL